MDIFFGNYYCNIKDNIYFVVISKNACTTLKYLTLRFRNYNITNPDNIHAAIGFEENNFLTKVINKSKIKANSIKFAVYRDPVDRFISIYKHFILAGNKRWYIDALNLRNDNNFDRFIEFAKFEISKSNSLMQDEHIRKQIDYYKEEDVDYIVKLEDLNDFLKYINIDPANYKLNNTDKYKDFTINDSQKEIIKNLYKDDYNILKSNKIWDKNKYL